MCAKSGLDIPSVYDLHLKKKKYTCIQTDGKEEYNFICTEGLIFFTLSSIQIF